MATAAGSQDRRYADLAVRLGLATEAQVEECLGIREKLLQAGAQAKSLPEVLHDKGYVTKEGARRLMEMGREAPARASSPGARPAGASSPAGAMGEGTPAALSIPGYEIIGILGKGGMGYVYKARQLSLGRIVALKVLSPEAARDETYVHRFMTEARALARLNHENIIAGIDVGEANGYRYFAMEYVEGEPLSKIIEREGALPEKRALKIVMQIARALAHASKNGLVHRDVKPQNIMVGRNDVTKLCDLGLAMTEDERREARERGQSIGTPHYVSPEQARGEHEVDIRSDIYSLGATLYHAVTGETPFSGTSSMVLMTKHLTEEPIPPRKRRPGLSKPLNDLILKMMAKEKERRYQSPIELLEDMERVLAGRPIGGSGSGRLPRKVPTPPRGAIPAHGVPRPVQPEPAAGRRRAGGDQPARPEEAAAPAVRGKGGRPAEVPQVKVPTPRRMKAQVLPSGFSVPQPGTRIPTPRRVPAARAEADLQEEISREIGRARRPSQPTSAAIPLLVALGVFVLGGGAAALLYKAVQTRSVEEPPAPTPEEETNAAQSYTNVINAFNAGTIDKFEAMAKLDQVARTFPRTAAAKKAEEESKRIAAIPIRKPGESAEEALPADEEALPGTPPVRPRSAFDKEF